jgi:hypothetical protein
MSFECQDANTGILSRERKPSSILGPECDGIKGILGGAS